MKASDRGRNVKSKELFGCFHEIFISMINSTKWNFSQWLTVHVSQKESRCRFWVDNTESQTDASTTVMVFPWYPMLQQKTAFLLEKKK